MRYREEDFLREKYIENRKSTREIAEMCDVSAPTIQKWLKKNDIPVRHGGEAVKTQWEGNEERREKQAEWMKKVRQPWWEMDDDTRERVRERLSEWWSKNNPMQGRTRDENPAWKGGKANWYGSNWEEQREKAIDRDGGECQKCGSGDDLVVHHHVPLRLWRDDPDKKRENANDLWNLVTLCSECHGEIESKRLRG